MPGTSVQISSRAADSLAARYAAEVSEPPRPSSTVLPSPSLAMKPWVTLSAGPAARRACSAASGAKPHVADSTLALGEAPRLSARSMEARPERGAHQLTARQHARPGAIAHLAHQRHPGGDLAQLREIALELLPGSHAELGGEVPVALLDGAQLLLLRLALRRVQQPFQPVGDARYGRVHDEEARPARQALGGNIRDVDPVRQARDARAAELQDDPGRGGH